ncbi:glycosyltransferase family 4 protein [Mucilaginibacter pallidiroseus]|uniref:Glycosyltransferase family 4 protein n=1 Tax=Mucilaginibacter pallidiroseus TaxID=2599295 RepID=A0A563U3H4_9SPHI|nr:glycosyltransferase [Mucilaginibacter pallidiroseus]TWR25898.1 glycosyltransferase family 4 protein [Mucilaginibacter pallidiroseus]
MKIAVIAKTRLAIAEPFRGGLEAFTHSLCKEYINLGHDITLYAHAESDPALNVKTFYGNEHREDRQYEIYENEEYLSIIRDIDFGNFDVVHNNATHELPVIWGAKASIPVVTTIHTPPTSKLKAAVKLCSGSPNLHFVVPSNSFQKTWQPYLEKGSAVIYNGVDMDKWPLVRASKDYLFWYGRIVHAKGLDIVLDAANEINMPLKFAGSIDDTTYFEEQIKPRMNDGHTYLSHLNQADIHMQMRGAAATVSAVRWEEPFGLTNIEAMCAGVPVAGFNRGAFSELINEDSGIVAAQNNVGALAKAIQAAMQLDSGKVRQYAEKFSLRTMAERYVNYFEKLL